MMESGNDGKWTQRLPTHLKVGASSCGALVGCVWGSATFNSEHWRNVSVDCFRKIVTGHIGKKKL